MSIFSSLFCNIAWSMIFAFICTKCVFHKMRCPVLWLEEFDIFIFSPLVIPWYSHHGWLGSKNQFCFLPSTCQCFNWQPVGCGNCEISSTPSVQNVQSAYVFEHHFKRFSSKSFQWKQVQFLFHFHSKRTWPVSNAVYVYASHRLFSAVAATLLQRLAWLAWQPVWYLANLKCFHVDFLSAVSKCNVKGYL